jgi:hypothetical protein
MRVAARTATVVCAATVSLAVSQPVAPVAQAVPSVGEIVAAAEKYLPTSIAMNARSSPKNDRNRPRTATTAGRNSASFARTS